MPYKECGVSGWVWAQAQGLSGQEGSTADWSWTPAPSVTSWVMPDRFLLSGYSLRLQDGHGGCCPPAFWAAGEQQVR